MLLLSISLFRKPQASLFYLSFIFKFEDLLEAGNWKNHGSHLIWSQSLSFKWVGGQNLKFPCSKHTKEWGISFKEGGCCAWGYCSLSVLTPTPTIFAWQMWNECRVSFCFLTEYPRVFLKEGLMRSSFSLVLMT